MTTAQVVVWSVYCAGYGYALHSWKDTLKDGGFIVRAFLSLFWPVVAIYDALEDV